MMGDWKQAPEPTDIIWENLDFNNKRLYKREFIAYSAVLIVLFCGFTFNYLTRL